MQVVRVEVAGEHYGLPVEQVRGVERVGTTAAIPGAPPELLGLRSVRGRPVPVIDLPRRLGIGHSGAFGFVVVVEHAGWLAGLAVDDVHGVETIEGELEPVDAGALQGATLADGVLVGVVDVVDLLAEGGPGTAS